MKKVNSSAQKPGAPGSLGKSTLLASPRISIPMPEGAKLPPSGSQVAFGQGVASVMATGPIKSFNLGKGYEFIMPQDGGEDVFLHITAVQAAGISSVNDGQKVSYDVVTERGQKVAPNPKKLG